MDVSVPVHLLVKNGIFVTYEALGKEDAPEDDKSKNGRKTEPNQYGRLVVFQLHLVFFSDE